jgi:hypothetical protein
VPPAVGVTLGLTVSPDVAGVLAAANWGDTTTGDGLAAHASKVIAHNWTTKRKNRETFIVNEYIISTMVQATLLQNAVHFAK